MNSALLDPCVLQYQPLIEKYAVLLGLRPETVAAIGCRETAWGTSKDCDVQGPSCTGDRGPRNPSRWGSALPPDGRGWGRGLMQVDFGGHKDWCLQKVPNEDRYLWEVPEENIKMACQLLHAAQTACSNVTGEHAEAAMVCAYNAGTGAAFRALQPPCPDPLKALDARTTGGDYVTWVLDRRDKFAGACLPR